MDFSKLTISGVHKGLVNKDFSAIELAEFHLEKIKESDKKIGAFLQISEELALSQAEEVDKAIARGEELPLLAGVPIAIKDNILVKGLKCTAGSRILENYEAVYNATVIEKLIKEKAVILGKTNLDEFAMGSSTENSAFQKTYNPRNLEYVPGGSSGGSVAAVSAGQAYLSLGSDTGGSIRQPASFCGVVGLKPTYGTVSRFGLIAFASSLDQIGPIARNVEDVEIAFKAIKGWDKKDSTTVKLPAQTESKLSVGNLRIGLPKEYFTEGIDSRIKENIISVIEKLKSQGAEVKEVSLPHTQYAIPCYYILACSEASANLARYDGIRYGYSDKEAKTLMDIYLDSRGKGFGPEVKRRIMLGTYALSAGYYDAYYMRAQKVRTLIKDDFDKAFKDVDVIITPTTPTLPFKIGEKIENPLEMYMSDILTAPTNLAGLPGMSIPSGEIDGLPVGLQIIAKPFQEADIFQVGKIIENVLLHTNN